MDKKLSKKRGVHSELSQFTNKEFLKELGQRIVSGRLELENDIEFAGLIKTKRQNQTHYFDILDNEWKDKTKPDYTGARTGLNYWMVTAKTKQKLENDE